MKKRILLIEDEKHMSRFIELELEHESFEVQVALDGHTGLHYAMAEEWDIILLDLMLPGVDGMEICRRVRTFRRTPIIMITARDRVTDRVLGLDCGADDYLPKPFAMEELLARMRVVLRRQEDQLSRLVYQELSIELDARIVRRGDKVIDLTKREYDLLVTFMMHPNRAMDRELLLDKVWGVEAAVDKNVVDVYVRYLRNKIDISGTPSYIQTLRGIGYVMRR